MNNFKRMKLALIVTYFGSWFNLIAFISVIYSLTGSKQAVGLSFLVKFLPKVIFGFMSAFILDRYSKKKVLIISEVFSFFSVLGMLLLIDKPNFLSVIYLFYFILGASTSIFDIARTSIIPELLEDKSLYGKAVSDFTVIRYATMLIATGLGGLLLERFGVKVVLSIDVLSFLISAIIISTLKFRVNTVLKNNMRLKSNIESIVEDIKLGFQEVLGKKSLLKIILTFACFQFVYGIAQVAFPLVILDNLSKINNLSKPSFWLGISYTVGGIGCVLSGVFFKRTHMRVESKKLDRFIEVIIYPLNAIVILLLFSQNNIFMFLGVVFIHDVVNTFREIYFDSSIITIAGENTVGRINAFYITTGRITHMLGTVLYSSILGILSFQILGLILAGIMLIGIGINYLFLNKNLCKV